MVRFRKLAIGLVLLLPAAALAGYDPILHVDPSREDCSLRVGVADDLDVGAYYAQNPLANYGWRTRRRCSSVTWTCTRSPPTCRSGIRSGALGRASASR
jgi:hypothetical protein